MTERQEQTAPDAVMTRIGQVVMLCHAGDREEARHRFLELWAELGEDGDPLHRCTLAHYMADAQDDPCDELAWDLRALTAAEELTADRLTRREGALAVRALYPSLHLNLAADYVRLARTDAARTHLRRARRAADALGEDNYSDGVRAAISRLELRLGEHGSAGDGGWGPPRQLPCDPGASTPVGLVADGRLGAALLPASGLPAQRADVLRPPGNRLGDRLGHVRDLDPGLPVVRGVRVPRLGVRRVCRVLRVDRSCVGRLSVPRLRRSRRGPRRPVTGRGPTRLRGPGRVDHGQRLLGRGLHDLRLRLTVRAGVARPRRLRWCRRRRRP